MKHSQEVLMLATKIEKIALQKILSAVSQRYKKEVAPTMPTREQSDSQYGAELQSDAVPPSKASSKVSLDVRSVHEASRAQRDIEIIQAGHKRLMLACLDAAAKRADKLERHIQAMEKTPS